MATNLQRRELALRTNDESKYLIEVLSKNFPEIGPLETDTIHIVVCNFDQLLQAEQTRMLR